MWKRFIDLFHKYNEIVVYLLLGIFVTVANFAVYYPLHNLCGFSATTSNLLAWLAAVLVAFITNKPIVFKSLDWSLRVVIPEFTKFVAFRIGSGVIETLFLTLTVDIIHWDGNIMKLLISVFVVISNYIASKYFVFKK